MSMSTHVTGFVSPDEPTYKKHSAVLRVCIDAGVTLPKETAAYFGSEYADEHLFDEKLEVSIPHHEYSADMTEGFEIILSEIPEGVHKIRFTNSY